jgi:uncharacterized repeat protein (TIGR02543 family)
VTVSVPLRTPSGWTKTGYSLKGWATSQRGGVAYAFGGSYSHQFLYDGTNQSHSVTLYACWQPVTYTVKYNANGGANAPASQTKVYNVNLTLSSIIPTRSGYRFLGWATSQTGTPVYQAGDTYSANTSVTLYAIWSKVASDVAFVGSVQVGSQVTIRITANASGTINKLTYSCGSASGTIAENVSGSGTIGGHVDYSWTVPNSLANQAPDSAYVNLTVVCETFIDSASVGSSSVSATAPIPNASPFQLTVNIVAELVNDNATVDGWGIAVSGFTKIKLTASATPKYGASITSYTFSGPNFSDVESSSAASVNVTTGVLTVDGSLTYQVKVYDSRGFAKTAFVSVTAYPYSAPSVELLTAYRSDSSGDPDPVDGRRLSASVKYSVSGCNGHNSAHASLKYKKTIDSSYTNWISSAVSENVYTTATDILIANAYDVQVELTDDLGLVTISNSIQVASVIGYAFGLYNDRVRFGGPCRIAGFECDWNARFNGRIFAPDHAQRGFVQAASMTAGEQKSVTITFGDEFSISPNVVATLFSQSGYIGNISVSVYDISTSGFKLRIENMNNSSVTVGANWIAIL